MRRAIGAKKEPMGPVFRRLQRLEAQELQAPGLLLHPARKSWREVPGLRGRIGEEARPKRKHLLRLRWLSRLQAHIAASPGAHQMPQMRAPLSGDSATEKSARNDVLSEQRVRFRNRGSRVGPGRLAGPNGCVGTVAGSSRTVFSRSLMQSLR